MKIMVGRALSAAVLLLLLGACGGAPERTTSDSAPIIPKSVLLAERTVSQARISPDGKWISALQAVSGKQRLVLWSTDCVPCEPFLEVPLGGDRPFMSIWTERSGRLLVVHQPAKPGPPHISAFQVETSRLEPLPGALADAQPAFIQSEPIAGHALPTLVLKDPSGRYVRVDTSAGEMASLPRVEGAIPIWKSPDSDLVIAVRFGQDYSREWLSIAGGQVRTLISFSQNDALLRSSLLSVYREDGKAYGLFLDSSKTDSLAVSRLNLVSGESKVLASDKADVRNVLLGSNGEPLAFATEFAVPAWHSSLEAVHSALDSLAKISGGFPEVAGTSADLRLWLVEFLGAPSFSGYYLYDTSTKRLRALSSNSPNPPSRSVTEGLTIPGLDGSVLISYFTPPESESCAIGARPCPLVILLHGGPHDRDRWNQSNLHRLLANRGYAVLSVNYRGSRGFGKTFENAGERDWGGGEARDVGAAYDWITRNRSIDSKRVAVMGGSHGGYLALQTVASGNLEARCVVAISASSDLVAFVEGVATSSPNYAPDLYRSVGDPRVPAQRELMIARSPASHLDQFRNREILLIHGSKDVMAPVADIRTFSELLEKKSIPVTLVEYPDEGHVFRKGDAEQSLYGKTERFLRHCLGGRAEPPGPNDSLGLVVRSNDTAWMR